MISPARHLRTALLLALLPAVLAAEGPPKIRLGTLAPKGSSYFRHLQAMGEQWRAAPGGGVQLTIYPDGTMGSEADMVRRMRLGQLQAGMLTTVGLAEIEPGVTGLQNIPLLFRSLEEADLVGNKLRPMLEKRLEQKGFIVLCWCDTGWVRFFSKKPVIQPDDLRRTKLFVWAGSPTDINVYRSVGCQPVPLETVDILTSLQTGLIDAVPLPPAFALAAQVDQVAPHMLALDWAPLVGALVVTRKSWEALPPSTRDALRAPAEAAGKRLTQDARRESDESVEAMRKRGLHVHPVPPDLLAVWHKEVDPQQVKVRGTLVPADIFDAVVSELQAIRSAQPAGPP